MPIPKIIHFVIVSPPSSAVITAPKSLTKMQLDCVEAARRLHPDWEVRLWQDPLDPSDFSLGRYWSQANSGAQLADLIRLDAVYQHGGFYLDSDILLHRSLESLRDFNFVGCSEDGLRLSNGFFGTSVGNPLLGQLIKDLADGEVDWSMPPNMTTGPHMFTRGLRWSNDVTPLPRETFYPYSFDEKPVEARLWAYGTHLWARSWGGHGSRNPLRKMAGAVRRAWKNFSRKGLVRVRNAAVGGRQLWGVKSPGSFTASGVICAQTIHGPKIYLFGEDGSLTPEIALHGTYEFLEEQFIKRVVRRGDWAIDVGANIGMFSILLAQAVGPFGRAFSYEPNPMPAELLKRSLAMNWLHAQGRVRQKAVGAAAGKLQLRFSRERLGDATLLSSGTANTFQNTTALLGSEEVVDVEVASLDSEFPTDLSIRFLKVDAEGFEHEVLRGARRLFERQCIDILMMECIQELFGKNWGDLLAELRKLVEFGYEPYLLTRRSKLRRIAFDKLFISSRGRNVFFVSPDAKRTISELS